MNGSTSNKELEIIGKFYYVTHSYEVFRKNSKLMMVLGM